MPVILGRLCTICAARKIIAQAVNIAKNAEGLEWFECANHDEDDHNREFQMGKRIHTESTTEFFKRHFPHVDPV